MKQDWSVVCLDTHESIRCIGKLGEALYRSAPEWIEGLVTKSKLDLTSLPIKPFAEPKLLSPLEKLPLEVIERVLLFMLRSAAVFCLALPCYCSLEIGRCSIKEKYAAPWAGKHIICVADYAK
ncbi:hypothetical protein BX667DRAFT_499273, partial [Coemansia mojavensis]